MEKKNALDEIEKSFSDLNTALHYWSKNLFFAAVFLFCTLLLLFKTPIFPVLAICLIGGILVSSGLLVQIAIKKRKLRERLNAYLARPEGRIASQIQEIHHSILRFQQKLKSYELSLREGRSHLAQVEDALSSDQLYENRRTQHHMLKKKLEENLAQQQLVMEFYQKAKSRYEQELFNLEQDLNNLELSTYLQKESINYLGEEISMHSTKLSVEMLSEMEKLESHLPAARAELIDFSLAAQLKEMIHWLDHSEPTEDSQWEHPDR
ncbi:MAG: hypothetical protein AAF694_04030 [Bacteroidota bacterium]